MLFKAYSQRSQSAQFMSARPMTTLTAMAFGLCAILLTAGCATLGPQSQNTVAGEEVGRTATVKRGSLVSLREVELEGTSSGVGVGAGAIAGGIGGSFLGGGDRANILGALGGALIGGIAGLAAEEAVTGGKGVELLIELDSGRTVAVVQGIDPDRPLDLRPGDRVLVIYGETTRVTRDLSPNTNNEAFDRTDIPEAGAPLQRPAPQRAVDTLLPDPHV